MTKGIFKFQLVQNREPAIDLTNLPATKLLKISQRNNIGHLLIEIDKIGELIQILTSCKKWSTLP